MNESRSVTAALAANPVLGRAATAELAEMACAASRVSFQAGELVLGQNDTSLDVFVVETGRLLAILFTADGREVAYGEIDAGELFGELAALDGKARSVGVNAIDAVTLIRIPPDAFRAFLARSPDVPLALMQALSGRIRRLTNRNFEMIAWDVEQRVRAYILRRAIRHGQLKPNGTLTDCPTHAQIASRIGTNREEVSRTLGKLVKSGVLRTGRKKIEILNPDRLLDGMLETGDYPV